MPTVEQLRSRLIGKLKELFQLDQPDLDFGFYRIMHAKNREVDAFLKDTLPGIIGNSFGGVSAEEKAKLQAAYDAAVQTARNFGASDPEATEPVKKAKAAWVAAGDTVNDEAEVYDHLFRFFERYYDNGDFVSLRYLTRETDRKAKPYAVPYGGEEVMLHWANSDQYYIKTTENFSNFTFDLAQAKEFGEMSAPEKMLNNIPDCPMKAHFKVVEAEEGDHGNIKAGTERFFLIHEANPVELGEGPEAELTVSFEYRSDPEKTGQANAWRGKRNREARAVILKRLESAGNQRLLHAYLTMFSQPIPTDADKERVMLDRYIERYTAKNSSDYFIHKDLGGFLKRELDFYIKNEIMQLDNIVNQEAPAVESYLTKLKVLRNIATQLIEFLAQLENFQKKLWLKKKFVVECDYCITLDRLPQELRQAAWENPRQLAEWQKLGLLSDPFEQETQDDAADLFIKGEIITLNLHNKKLTLKYDYRYLMVDTKFFDDSFKAALLATIPDLDEQCNGLLIHSENFQALNLLQDRYREQVKCIYIDPPYNTGEDNFPYKDTYQSASWMSMFFDRLQLARFQMNTQGLLACHMDEHEHMALEYLIQNLFGKNGDLGKLIWDKKNPKGDSAGIAVQHEYIHFAANEPNHLKEDDMAFVRKKPNAPAILAKAEKLIQKAKGVTEQVREEFQQWVRKSNFSNGEKAYCFLDANGNVYRTVSMAWPNKKKAPDEYFHPLIHPVTGKKCPIPARGWRNPPATMNKLLAEKLIVFGDDEKTQPTRKYLLKENLTENVPSLYYMGGSDDKIFKDLNLEFENPKPVVTGEHFISVMTRNSSNPIILDYFAGSGTTGHAVINLNREDEGHRKYILVEMGDHFDNVLKPRIEKVVFSPEWKDGRPKSKADLANSEDSAGGVSHCFKYMRLESYEDTLNNLELSGGEAFALDPELQKDYLLHYMLDVESRDSASLLNIRAFENPFDYKLKVKKPGSEESEWKKVDLLETFNYLIGLRVKQMFAPQRFSAEFERPSDPELPQDQKTRLTLKNRLRLDSEGNWTFRKVEGTVPKNRFTPNDGLTERVLVIWRNLTGNPEQDNLVLDEFLKRECLNMFDGEFDTVYVNGSNNVPNLRRDQDQWKVRLIEEDFMTRMWETEGV